MAWKSHYRKRYTEYIREVLGDKERDAFDTDEMLSYVEGWIANTLTTTNIQAYNSRYHISQCGRGKGVYLLQITVGIDDAVYIIDEQTGLIIFDPDDPLNTAIAPVDGSSITVSYYETDTPELLSELFMVWSSNHVKLRSYQSIMGVKMDLKELSDGFYNQSIRWSNE